MPRLSNSSRILLSPSPISRCLTRHCWRCRPRRWIVQIETGPAYCPTARSRRFGRWEETVHRSAYRIIDLFLAAGLPSWFAAMAHLTTASQVRPGKEYAHARTSQGGHGSKPGATHPGRSNDMPNVSPHRVILSGPVGERFYQPIREREDIGSMTSLLVSRI